MKKQLVLILLLIALPVIILSGCTLPEVNRGEINVMVMIPEEFEPFANDITLDKVIVIAKKDNEKREIITDVINQERAEILFEALEAGPWTFSVAVKDTDDETIFTGTEIISVSANISTPATISLLMEKATLKVIANLPAGYTYLSGTTSLLNYEGNADLTRPFTIIDNVASAIFTDISPRICDAAYEVITTEDPIRGNKSNVKILPGRTTILVF